MVIITFVSQSRFIDLIGYSFPGRSTNIDASMFRLPKCFFTTFIHDIKINSLDCIIYYSYLRSVMQFGFACHMHFNLLIISYDFTLLENIKVGRNNLNTSSSNFSRPRTIF